MFVQDQVGNVVLNGDGAAPQAAFDIRQTTSSTVPTIIANQPTSSTGDFMQFRKNNVNVLTISNTGNIVTPGSITASNLRVLGDYVILDTITSNTEQMVITNDGTGPALKVTQTGANSIAEFYDDGNALAFKVANDGLIGIGTATPQAKLHVVGSAIVSSNLNVTGNLVPTAINLASTSDTTTAATHYFVETGTDGFIRPKTLANATAELVTTASVNSAAATTVGTITSGVWNAGALASSSTVSATTQFLAPSGGLVGAPGFSWTGNAGTGIYRPVADTVAFVTASNERVRVDASGNVGIGTTIPTQRLSIESFSTANVANISLKNTTSSNTWYFHQGGSAGTNIPSNSFSIGDLSAHRVSILSNGNVGIGTTSPTNKLDVNGVIGTTYVSNVTLAANNTLTTVLDPATNAHFDNFMNTTFGTRTYSVLASVSWDFNNSASTAIFSISKFTGFTANVVRLSGCDYNGATSSTGTAIQIRNGGIDSGTPRFRILPLALSAQLV
jgi:hypothetical protein